MLNNPSGLNPKIAIIGGSGLEDPNFFKEVGEIKVKTPFGDTSSPIRISDLNGQKIAFLSRHGANHGIPPHMVNSKANIWALKELGVERIIGICAVGSLKEEYKPGNIVVCDQSIDFTKKRDYTFYDDSAVHISLADPFCPELRSLFFEEAKKLEIPAHESGTYACIEGPRFSTKAESKFFMNFADVIGMTLVPEAQLAKELGICYLSLAMVTDYDCWKDHPVTYEEVARIMGENQEKIKKILNSSLSKINSQRNCSCSKSLESAEA
ncbi:MAG: S-methyl-5'-thioadenosine phosphorylase [Candidatus Pacebacteria bacterium]|nr:S-methyl-5'-thioadenosine phosphorylase [Candidatus Paceibacterota bacterium]